MNLSQAAQFNGPVNSVINSYATAAQALGYTYEQYKMFAQAYSTLAVLSEAEYRAKSQNDTAVSALVTNAMRKRMTHYPIEQSIAQAVTQGTSVIEVSVDEQDNILLKHWDANMLFNHRNHTE